MPLPNWSFGEMLFLGTAVGSCIVFTVSVMGAMAYVALGARAARETAVVTPAVRPSDEAPEQQSRAA
jgi:hypothetical protein